MRHLVVKNATNLRSNSNGKEFDCIRKMRLDDREPHHLGIENWPPVEKEDYETVEGIRKTAWEAYLNPIIEERTQVLDMLDEITGGFAPTHSELNNIKERLSALRRR